MLYLSSIPTKLVVAVSLLVLSLCTNAQLAEPEWCAELSEFREARDSDLDIVEELLREMGKESLKEFPELAEMMYGDLPDGYLYFFIGECYLFGQGVEQSDEVALAYLEKASERGYKNADHLIASILVFKSDDAEKQRRGVEMLRAEFEAGSWYAGGKLGWAYQRGLGVPVNLKRALELYRGVAERGGTYWQYLLAHAHEKGYLGLEQSEDKAAFWKGLPKIHIDTYDCWVRNYYQDGIFPRDEELQAYHDQRCNDPHLREQEIHRLWQERTENSGTNEQSLSE